MMTALFQKNMNFFDKEFPEIAEKLKAVDESVSSVVLNDAAQPIDIELGGKGRLYKAEARSFSQNQAEHFFSHPRVIILNRPSGAGTIGGVVADDFNWALGKKMNEAGIWEISQLPLVPSGLMLVLGVGLGFHLPAIIDKTRCHTVVIVETVAEFLLHSLYYTDWTALEERARLDGRKFKVILENNPNVIGLSLHKILDSEGGPSLDGTYVYTHYSSWIFDKVAERLADNSYSYFITRGFFEDEVRMISNATRNFLQKDFHLIEGENRLVRPEPIFVIGSGPSIDKSLETIRKWQEYAIIFSSGTALRVLLSNGIRPDYHCELENGEATYEVLSSVKREFGLEGIKLIASSTIIPKAAALFDEVSFFFRDSVSSTMILAAERGYKNLDGTAPTCTNTAFAAATVFGFQEIYLFGLDCGVRDPERHHSTSSIYYTHEKFKNSELKFPLEVPANFGGMAYTNWVYDMTRRMIEGLKQTMHLRLFNCSDGALINGATPKVSRSLKFSSPIDKEKVFADIRQESKFFAAADFFRFGDRKYHRFLDAFDEATKEIDCWLDKLPETCHDVHAFCLEVNRFMKDLNKRHLAVSQLVSASICNIPRIAEFYLLRIEDREKREKVFYEMLDEYARLVRGMLAEGRSVYAGLTKEAEAVGV